jgi:hypothetical protein
VCEFLELVLNDGSVRFSSIFPQPYPEGASGRPLGC